jgi:hypothetical protein
MCALLSCLHFYDFNNKRATPLCDHLVKNQENLSRFKDGKSSLPWREGVRGRGRLRRNDFGFV